MVVGDFVVDVFAQAGVSSFQPAVGVTIMISGVYSYTAWADITDGTLISHVQYSLSSGPGQVGQNYKFFINNDHYLRIEASGEDGKFYSGVQVA